MATSLVKLSDAMKVTPELFPNKYNSNIEMNKMPSVLVISNIGPT